MSRATLDPKILEELKGLQCEGGPDILVELAKLFIETMEGPASNLREAVAARNFSEIESTAHVFKSSSANVGALKLSDVSQKLEIAGESKNAAGLEELLTEFDTEFAAAITELKLI